MKLFVKSVKVIDSQSDYNNQIVDILIDNGIIKSISKQAKIPKDAKIIEHENLHVSPGFFDLKANFRDPGHEIKEDLNSGTLAANKGGFTGVLLMPSNNPTTDSKTQVNYLKNYCENKFVDIYPAGSITKENKGKELTEMYDMFQAGAVAFSDDINSIQKAGVLKLALEYNKYFDGLVINQPNDKSLDNNGLINEGEISTILGLKGIPSISEEIMVKRDIELADYTNSKIHLSCISTEKSVELIREAKTKGIKVSCDVSINNLVLNDSHCKDFDTNYKIFPPLRSQTDTTALIKGLKDGTIDAICSDHKPEDIEHKQSEFENASFGIIGLQTLLPMACSLLPQISLNTIIEKISINPRKILKINKASINIDESVNLCFYNPEKTWKLKEGDIVSKSKNTPFLNQTMKGKVIGTVKGLESNL
jgi:dihydroorotase